MSVRRREASYGSPRSAYNGDESAGSNTVTNRGLQFQIQAEASFLA